MIFIIDSGQTKGLCCRDQRSDVTSDLLCSMQPLYAAQIVCLCVLSRDVMCIYGQIHPHKEAYAVVPVNTHQCGQCYPASSSTFVKTVRGRAYIFLEFEV